MSIKTLELTPGLKSLLRLFLIIENLLNFSELQVFVCMCFIFCVLLFVFCKVRLIAPPSRVVERIKLSNTRKALGTILKA